MPQVDISTVPQTTNDFADLRHLFAQLIRERQPKLILEIGTDVGDSTRLWSALLQETQGHLWTVDIQPPKGDWPKTWPLKNITFVQSDSLLFQWRQKVDLLFLDGNHAYEHVTKELEHLGPWVRAGGIIACHDTLHDKDGEGIRRAIHSWTVHRHLTWTHYPVQHGLGIIEVSYDLPVPPLPVVVTTGPRAS